MLTRLAVASCILVFAVTGVASAVAADAWTPVPPMDWTKAKPEDFSDAELDMPFYVEHFHELANAVVETAGTDGPRGWISEPFWRDVQYNKPWNARVIENYEALAYFYCTKRPWNPYYASPAVRKRLEAVLELWLSMQGPKGEFSEYGDKKWNLPATAFATKFIGRTIELLQQGGTGAPIDAGLLQRVIDADRRAVVATLTIPQFYKDGKVFSNQFENVFGGAALYAGLFKDKEIATLLNDVFRKALVDFQSPAGFLYENNSADFGYTLHTTHSNMIQAYSWGRGTETGALIEAQERKWTDWISYNLVREPDGSTFFINRGIESRQTHMAWVRQPAPWGEKVEAARAFAPSREELAAETRVLRERMVREWGKPTKVPTGDGAMLSLPGADITERANVGDGKPRHIEIQPYAFLDQDYYQWTPTAEQRDAAVAKLPYLARDRFVHQRVDSRYPLVCTYVRRPAYYAAFNAGTIRNPHQRYGLGIVWSPVLGTILQSQTKTTGEAWGTRLPGSKGVVEAGDLLPTLTLAGKPIDPAPGARDLDGGEAGEVVARYALGSSGEKTVTFGDAIDVKIWAPGALVEQLPLLVAADVVVNGNRATATTDKGTLTVELDNGVTAAVRPTDLKRAGKRLVVLELSATDHLSYRIVLPK